MVSSRNLPQSPKCHHHKLPRLLRAAVGPSLVKTRVGLAPGRPARWADPGAPELLGLGLADLAGVGWPGASSDVTRPLRLGSGQWAEVRTSFTCPWMPLTFIVEISSTWPWHFALHVDISMPS